MGGKSSTQTSSVSIPPDVLARYNSVNSQAQTAAAQPFQQYSTDPNAFVAPLDPTQLAGIANTNSAAGQAQPYYQQATGMLEGAQQATGPYYGAATGALLGAQQTGANLADASLGSLASATGNAQPLQSAASQNYNAAYQNAQPYIAASGQDVSGAQGVGSGLGGASLAALLGGYSQASPLQGASATGLGGALSSAQPYNQIATGLAAAGAGPVNAQQIGGQQIGQFLSPYLQSVLQGTAGVLNQQNQQQQSGQLGNAIQSGAFGGDRAGIAAANLEQQQNLANSQIYSNILNQGFNTALGAAQQQQGVNLGASQANRAALQTAAGQLQGIGAQQYGQGTGTAEALGALGGQEFNQGLGGAGALSTLSGQQFGQGLSAAQQQAALGAQQFTQGTGLGSAQQGLGQQEYTQGANTASQLAGLGQQQFAQGANTSSGLAGLGQDIYSTGAQTASSLAGLGSGAQSASLQGAAAQQAAGATQQQTQQAGQTALYNQFLQQQSYPFQVAQFLANIAEGTGALSGSTTTTTTPGGLFSDRRLKEDVRRVGKTFDGQTIYSFRYKDDPDNLVRMGLMAQDVEKHHPDAVGLAGGFKTVDYGEATADAARRGHFARGGLAGANDNHYAFGGSIDDEMDQLLAQRAQMYGTAGGGVYGGGLGAVRGGSSYVPSANLPVGRLAVAQPPTRGPSGADQINNFANAGLNIEKGIKGGEDLWSKYGPKDASIDTSGDTPFNQQITPDLTGGLGDVPPMRRGGRTGFADGGVPYDDQISGGLDIPDEKPGANLAVAQPAGGSAKSGIGQIGQLASSLGSIASLAGQAPGIASAIGSGVAAAGSSIADLLPLLAFADGGSVPGPETGDDLIKRLLGSLNTVDQPPDETDQGDASSAPAPPANGAGPDIDVAQKVASAAANIKTPSQLGDILPLIAKAEGTGKNPNSSAKGLYQIIDPTFVGAFKQMFPDRAAGMSNQDILSLRSTPQGDQISSQMGPFLAKQNAATLQQQGYEPSAQNVYLAHLLGPGGAVKVLGADPATPLDKLLPAKEITANAPIMAGKTAGDLTRWSGARMAKMAQSINNRATFADGGLAGTEPEDDGASPPIPSEDDNAAPQPNEPPGGAHSGFGAGLGDVVHNLGDQIKKPEVFIPLLTGLAAWAGAPTQHPLVALAQGLGAAGQAYQGQRQFGLEQQKVAQSGQQVGIEQQLANYRPWELGIRGLEAQAHVGQIQNEWAARALPLFEAQYPQLRQVDATGNPMYRDLTTGNIITQQDYVQKRDAFMQRAFTNGLAGMGGSSLPGAMAANGANNNANAGLPPVPAGPGAGASAPVVGAALPAGGGAPGGAGPVDPGGGAVAGAGPQPAPRLLSRTGSTVAEKLRNGAYMGAAQAPQSVDMSNVSPATNPSLLMRQGMALVQNSGDPASVSTGQSMMDRAGRIERGEEPALTNDGQPYYGFAQSAAGQGVNAKVMAGYAQQIDDRNRASSVFSQQLPGTQQVLNSLQRVYSETNTNRLSEDWADLIGKVSSVPVLSALVSPQLKVLQSNVDEAHKDAARQAIVQAVQSNIASHAPAAALHQTNLTVPGPGMAPGARYNLVVQMQALLNQAKDANSAWAQNKGQVQDVASYDNDWQGEHPIQNYEQRAYDQIAPFPGMTKAEMIAHPRRPSRPSDLAGLRPGVPFVIPSGPNKGKIGYTQ